MEGITYSNFRIAARRVFREDTVVPQLAFYGIWETRGRWNRWLRSNFPHRPGLSIEFDLSGIEALRDSENARPATEDLRSRRSTLTGS